MIALVVFYRQLFVRTSREAQRIEGMLNEIIKFITQLNISYEILCFKL